MLTLTAFVSLILSVYGQTRFVIDNYTIPDTSDIFALFNDPYPTISRGSPYPLDVCVGYEVAFTLMGTTPNLFTLYGMYSCNGNNDGIIFTDYGEDSLCDTPTNENGKTFDASTGNGQIGTFNCIGENNYVTIIAYTIGAEGPGTDGGDICCGADWDSGVTFYGEAPTTLATSVCTYAEESGQAVYTAGTCNSDGSTTTIYGDNACTIDTGETASELSASSSSCARLGEANAQGTIYQRQGKCVINDVEQVPDPTFESVVCVTSDPTEDPSPAPTPATEPPTTAAPTTAEPTADPTEEDTQGIGYMFVVNYIVLLVLALAIFVN